MESWEVRKQVYKDAGRPQDQSFEDMLGRRVLKGLRISEKKLYNAEMELFGYGYHEDPLWIRASRIFTDLMERKSDTVDILSGWEIDTAQVSNDNQALERLVASGGNTLGVLFTMPKTNPGRDDGSVYAMWYKDKPIGEIEAPYRVLKHNDLPEFRITVQPVVKFIRQFELVNYE